jgi:glycosyltransferase involved in cell wall biosynthesis
MPQGQGPDVTVLVPAYNERATISEVIERLLALPLKLEVVVIDDGSTDGTHDLALAFGDRIKLITNTSALRGKARAIRLGLRHATGRVVVIQDADLEYSPEDIPGLVQPILDGKANVVFGTRFATGLPKGMAWPNKLVNRMLVWVVMLLYGRRITDEATCYKAFRRETLERMNLTSTRFEFCPEVTAKAIRLGEQIVELPIRYEPRSKSAGKKIRWTDAPAAFWTLLKHRFSRF